ncbi:hypothetical protein P3X46_003730 [Hevea brasiliensis]|uniref:Uncharacterized protein n=1 Tax=Hevea brasiliensis TaxID=3981 RepID=A0ABQ9N7W3_HEVBR|nr:hypothetical protein P3X46_003730 [Hevea brasiliensis]
MAQLEKSSVEIMDADVRGGNQPHENQTNKRTSKVCVRPFDQFQRDGLQGGPTFNCSSWRKEASDTVSLSLTVESQGGPRAYSLLLKFKETARPNHSISTPSLAFTLLFLLSLAERNLGPANYAQAFDHRGSFPKKLELNTSVPHLQTPEKYRT